MKKVRKVLEFEWDKGNIDKNKKHKVKNQECEQAFFDENKIILKDILHSVAEKRFILVGKTENKRCLYIIFTYRGKKLRIISARDINKKEVKLYEEVA
ncbi:hypothetical protein COS55_00995 [Candidatus Shapirobacteria bacterium CG03_land_8_20_14_0_80_40_19]|uniref:BrnT family toxin n=3 Tax=Candidatus Shapironibacteriota TaxID=1752721 RepID=A0A2M7BF82_9BACT|nr:MAG: hypothetical protein COV89_03175 [Candidatus Shapirobacteria bacterium CG11_big_fil_rev_8_21_14_0_20_40_12]PIV01785.1 MAG: hypothetical protein COS55_00995 [Candidatus Shapirobacteria bacterium CG03_land_8_20_14_0_80_40_19]PJC29165.1 MAG: hypothetical protein CO053_00835 [Candidatus Shapirobacteria bacterium CG_4_9_14_0_2_um_filter_40_11]